MAVKVKALKMPKHQRRPTFPANADKRQQPVTSLSEKKSTLCLRGNTICNLSLSGRAGLSSQLININEDLFYNKNIYSPNNYCQYFLIKSQNYGK